MQTKWQVEALPSPPPPPHHHQRSLHATPQPSLNKVTVVNVPAPLQYSLEQLCSSNVPRRYLWDFGLLKLYITGFKLTRVKTCCREQIKKHIKFLKQKRLGRFQNSESTKVLSEVHYIVCCLCLSKTRI